MSVIPDIYDIKIYRGADFSVTFTLKDGDGVAIDLSGFTITSTARTALERDATEIVTFANTLTGDGSGGIFVMSLTQTETLALDPQKGHYDVLFDDGSGLYDYYIKGQVDIFDTLTAIP